MIDIPDEFHGDKLTQRRMPSLKGYSTGEESVTIIYFCNRY